MDARLSLISAFKVQSKTILKLYFYAHGNHQSTPSSQKIYFAVSFWENYLKMYILKETENN